MLKQSSTHHLILKPGESIYTIREHDFHALLSPTEGAAPPLPNPNVTGTLSPSTMALFWSLVSYIGQKWAIQNWSSLNEAFFLDYLYVKTTQTPSYYTVYNMAQALYQTLVSQYGPQAPNVFYTPNGGASLPNWDVTRQWVIKEFLVIYVTTGAFRAYGWLNYPGYGGGAYNNPSKLPYRPYIPPSENGGSDV